MHKYRVAWQRFPVQEGAIVCQPKTIRTSLSLWKSLVRTLYGWESIQSLSDRFVSAIAKQRAYSFLQRKSSIAHTCRMFGAKNNRMCVTAGASSKDFEGEQDVARQTALSALTSAKAQHYHSTSCWKTLATPSLCHPLTRATQRLRRYCSKGSLTR